MARSALASQLLGGLVGRIVQSMAAGAVGQLLSVVYRLLLPPLFLEAWGVGLYGDWLLISAMTAYLALADIGGGMYVVNRCTQLYAARDMAQFRTTMQTALMVFTAIPGLVVAIFTITVYAIPSTLDQAFKFIGGSDAQAVATILAVQVFVSIPQALVLGTYRAIGEMPRGVMLANAILLLQIVFVGSGLAFGAGLPLVALLQLAPLPIVSLLAMVDLGRRNGLGGLYSSWTFDSRAAKDMFGPSLQFLLIQFSQAMSVQGILIVAGLVIGAAQVVQFATTRTLANVSRSAIGLLINSAWPEITRLDSQKEHHKLSDLFISVFRTTTVIAIIVGSALIVFGQDIYSAWLGRVDMYDADVMFLIVVALTFQVNWTGYGSLLMATNQHKALSVLTSVVSLLSIGLAYVGALVAGLEGMIFGMAASEIILLIAVPLVARRLFPFLTYQTIVSNALPLLAVPAMYAFPVLWVVISPALILWWAQSMKRLLGKRNGYVS